MKNILIISATGNSNYELSENIKKILEKNNISTALINIEDYKLPLYSSLNNKSTPNEKKNIDKLTKSLISSDALVICGPEYNGSISPIITNMIAWISVSTDYWKDAFIGKQGFVATSSGGPGLKFIKAMSIQLDHLGVNVYDQGISISSKNPFDLKKSEKILKQFISII